MKFKDCITLIQNDGLKDKLIELYGEEKEDMSKARYLAMLDHAKSYFNEDDEVGIFSAPGRSEIGGNHTDHQLGRVLAAAIDLDVIGVAKKSEDMLVHYYSNSFSSKEIDLNELNILPEEKNSTEALIRGIAAGLKEKNYQIGGFIAYAESDVLSGSGMSSSASFEVFIGTIFNHFYNNHSVTPLDIAKIGQYAENVYFMKACGLMDQLACAYGKVISIDFSNKDEPAIEEIPFNLLEHQYALILTDPKSAHDDLSDEYSAIPTEMKGVAMQLGQSVLSTTNIDELIDHVSIIREKCGDRAFLRAYHFVNETERAFDEAEALKANDIDMFLELICESGRSSWMYLQNVIANNTSIHQELAIGLALSEAMLGVNGAFRVHGGGFAGTIQAFVPLELKDSYIEMMEMAFGKDCCHTLNIRNCGGIQVC